jgi:hypothetical protein
MCHGARAAAIKSRAPPPSTPSLRLTLIDAARYLQPRRRGVQAGAEATTG